jgi:ornithine cyclodeaminase/alanine dehydrogenase-like protein (mu-crystallin family)
LGEAAAARKTPGEVTVFKSLGLAVEDVVAAHLALQRARERGIGKTI